MGTRGIELDIKAKCTLGSSLGPTVILIIELENQLVSYWAWKEIFFRTMSNFKVGTVAVEFFSKGFEPIINYCPILV